MTIEVLRERGTEPRATAAARPSHRTSCSRLLAPHAPNAGTKRQAENERRRRALYAAAEPPRAEADSPLMVRPRLLAWSGDVARTSLVTRFA